MGTRRQKVSEDRQAVVGRLNAGENSSLTIPPDDVIFEILLRLPLKCIARSRCLSKLWASVLEGQDFTDRYLTRSSARPHLLFVWEKDDQLLFFSSPQPQNQEGDNTSSSYAVVDYHMSFPLIRDHDMYPQNQEGDKTSSSHAVVDYHMSFPLIRDHDMYVPMAIGGLVCVRDKNKMAWVICNPSTGQSFTLPRRDTREGYEMRYFFGYDPVDKQFKLLSITWARGRDDAAISHEHQVLTLENGKLSWRMIECGVPHFPSSLSVCINGVLYYKADLPGFSSSTIMSFDVRSEKYSFINVMKPFTLLLHPDATLINYNGKLASVRVCGESRPPSFEMWVLHDLEKKQWSRHFYKLPQIWGYVYCAGVTRSNEVVLVRNTSYVPFFVFYYSLETGTSRIVDIHGIGGLRKLRVYTFVDHVEDVKPLKGVLGLLKRS